MDRQEQTMYERLLALLFLQNCLLTTVLREQRTQEAQDPRKIAEIVNDNRRKILGFIRGGSLPGDLEL